MAICMRDHIIRYFPVSPRRDVEGYQRVRPRQVREEGRGQQGRVRDREGGVGRGPVEPGLARLRSALRKPPDTGDAEDGGAAARLTEAVAEHATLEVLDFEEEGVWYRVHAVVDDGENDCPMRGAVLRARRARHG